MTPLLRLVGRWGRLEIALASLATVILVVMVLAQVVLRLVASPIVWVEEVGVYLFIWIIFLGAAGAYKTFQHLRVAVIDECGASVARMARYGANAAVLAIALLLIWHAPSALAIQWSSHTTSLPVDLPRALFFAVPLTYTLTSIALTAFLFLLTGPPAPTQEPGL